MSYILEALKRADAERSRVDPTLSDPLGPARLATSGQSHRASVRNRLLVGLVVSVAALATWWTFRQPAVPEASSVATTSASPTHAQASQQVGPPQTPATSPTPTPPRPAATTMGPPLPPILAPQPTRPVTRPPPPPVAPSDDGAEVASVPTPRAAPTPVTAPPATPMAGAPAGVKVTGSTYSDNPAHRMLIVNGKVVHEGQEVEPGLTLEVITPRSAVFNQNGSRFNVNY